MNTIFGPPINWVIFFFALCPYIPLIVGAIKIKNDKSQVVTTWFLYFLLDLITLITTVQEEGSYSILVGFSAGSLILAGVLCYQGRWEWRWLETIVLLLIIICTYLYFCCESSIALLFSVISETIVGMYLVYRTYKNPQHRYNLFSYTLFLMVAIITLFNSPEFTFKYVGFAISEIILSILCIIPLLIEKKKTSGYLFYN